MLRPCPTSPTGSDAAAPLWCPSPPSAPASHPPPATRCRRWRCARTTLPEFLQRRGRSRSGTRRGWCPCSTSRPVCRSLDGVWLREQCTRVYQRPKNNTRRNKNGLSNKINKTISSFVKTLKTEKIKSEFKTYIIFFYIIGLVSNFFLT